MWRATAFPQQPARYNNILHAHVSAKSESQVRRVRPFALFARYFVRLALAVLALG